MKLSTFTNAVRFAGLGASAGVRLRDKWLVFLLCSFGAGGHYRATGRRWLLRRFQRLGENGFVDLQFRQAPMTHPVTIRMRQDNESDYLVVAEIVRGGRVTPSFVPAEIVDCGANIGTFAIWAAAVFPGVPVRCYEPESANYEALKQNLARNDISTNCTHRIGVWSADTTLYFHAAESYAGYVDEHPPGEPIAVQFPEVGENMWLKLDVEGAEHVVIPEMLRRGQRPRFISMELHDAQARGRPLLALLRQHGYDLHGDLDAPGDCWEIYASRPPGSPSK